MVKTGYKHTDVGVIPDDWDVFDIEQVGTVIRGASPRPKGDKRFYGGDVPRLMVEDVTRDGKYVTPSVDFLTEEGAKRSRPCPKGTLTIVCSGTVGVPSFLSTDACIHDGFLALINIKKDVSNDFIYHFLKTQQTKFDNSATHGGVFTNLTTEILRKFKVPLPSNEDEQRAIAEALSDVDVLIASLNKLIAKKKAIKTAAMQQLLTGKKRLPGFSGDWVKKIFDECFTFLATGSNSRSELSDDGDVGYIHYGDIHTKWHLVLDCNRAVIPFISNEKVKKLPLLRDGDLVIADASEDNEGVGLSIEVKNIGECKIVAGLHTLLLRANKEDLADDFKAYITSMRAVKTSLQRIATGISVYGISKNNLRGVEIPLPPSVEEQAAIAKVLKDMQSSIDKLETRRDKTQTIKQGMMQELLTGRTRII